MLKTILVSVAHWWHDGWAVWLSQYQVNVYVGALQCKVENQGGVELVGQVVAHLVGHEHAVDNHVKGGIIFQKFLYLWVFQHILRKGENIFENIIVQ